MKQTIFIFIILLSSIEYAFSECGEWRELEKYEHKKKFDFALSAAKKWVESSNCWGANVNVFEYSIDSHADGARVFLNFIIRDNDGVERTSVGFDTILILNKKGKVIKEY